MTKEPTTVADAFFALTALDPLPKCVFVGVDVLAALQRNMPTVLPGGLSADRPARVLYWGIAVVLVPELPPDAMVAWPPPTRSPA